jgi:DNA invertase Pin-like site-specific DNA recombinase
MQYLNGGPWELLQEFREVESGKDDDRPRLREALNLCQLTGATLIIAKLDRLSRDLHFITSLMKAGTDFVACDMPQASRFTIHIYAALAEQERRFISERTRAALDAAKARGVKLGKPENATQEGRSKGILRSAEVRQQKAAEYVSSVLPVIREYQGQGVSLRKIAEALTARNILTARGKGAQWTAAQVKAVLDKAEEVSR